MYIYIYIIHQTTTATVLWYFVLYFNICEKQVKHEHLL